MSSLRLNPVFDLKLYGKMSLTIVGVLGMMAAAYFDGAADLSGKYGTLFSISLLAFLIGLGFSISSHYYWVRSVKQELD
jgi:hypothetical protein